MIISARERLLLKYLMNENHREVTIKELAEFADVSERTVHRDLKYLEDIIKKYDVELHKQSGVGVKLIGERLSELNELIQDQEYTEFTPAERKIIALTTLLDAKEPIKLLALANDLGVTAATVSHDLDEVESNLKRFGLTLVRKRGYGIELTGTEEGKRKAIRSLISERFDVPELISILKKDREKTSDTTDKILDRLLGLVQKDKLIKIETLVSEMNTRLPVPLADSSYVGLVVHLALALERIQRGETIAMKEGYLTQLKLTKEYRFAEELAVKLQEAFHQTIPEEEVGYITMHLRGAKLRLEQALGDDGENFDTAYLVNKLIRNVEQLKGVSFNDDPSLSQGLIAHLQPTLYRLKENMRISNPLLQQIKRDYESLFETVKEAVHLTFSDIQVPEEEIGYLVLHFGSALTTNQRSKIRILIICSSGIGTSKMLATKIRNQIPGIQHVESVSAFELKDINLDQYDLVLSTVSLEDFSREYLLVSPILTEEEIRKIKNAIGTKKVWLDSRQVVHEKKGTHCSFDFNTYKEFTSHSSQLIDILDSFDLYKMSEDDITIVRALLTVMNDLMKKAYINDEQGVLNAIKRREKLGGLGIPGTALALFHAKSDHVLQPMFHVIEFSKKQIVRSMDDSEQEINRIVLLLVPEGEKAETLSVLSFISSLIIQSEESIRIFETGNVKELTEYISKNYFTTMLKQLEE